MAGGHDGPLASMPARVNIRKVRKKRLGGLVGSSMFARGEGCANQSVAWAIGPWHHAGLPVAVAERRGISGLLLGVIGRAHGRSKSFLASSALSLELLVRRSGKPSQTAQDIRLMTPGRRGGHTLWAFSYARTPPILRPMSERTAARLAWSACGLSLLLASGGVVLHALNYAAPGVDRNGWWGSTLAIAAGLSVSGALVASQRRSNPIGWILLTMALTGATGLVAFEYGVYALGTRHGSLGGGPFALWFVSWGWMLAALLLPVFLLFPEGRLLSPRWRPVLGLAIALPALYMVGKALDPGPLGEPRRESFPSVVNPVGISGTGHVLDVLGEAFLPLVAATVFASLAALVARFRRARGETRQQLKWIAYGGAFLVLQFVVGPFVDLTVWQVLNPVAIVLFALALGIALVRYRLYDIDLLVNRTLVYAVLTACLVGAYIGTVALVGALIRHVGFVAPLVATALVAVLFAPLRLRLQRGVDRLLYGQRGEPYEVIAQLGARLEETPAPEQVLPTLVETVARALKLPYAAIELRRHDAFEMA